MNLIKGKQLLIATLIYVLTTSFVSLLIQPYAVTNFIGPAAGVATALVIIFGGGVLFSLIIGTISLNFILTSVNGVGIDLPVLLIVILAISLQSFWAKELTRHLVSKQRWLRSLPELLRFMLKIGPLTAIVSASAAVIIVMVNTKISGTSTVFVFFSTWVASVLSAVFCIPTALLLHGPQRLRVAKRVVVISSFILGLTAITLVLNLINNNEQHQRADHLEKTVYSFQALINKEVKAVGKDIRSLHAFFSSSNYVSLDEFNTFAAFIYKNNSSIRAFKWIPLIEDEHRERFEKSASEELGLPFVITQQLDTGQIITSATKASYLPTYYTYPLNHNESALGLDLLSHQATKITMEQALTLNSAVASPPLILVQDDHLNPAVLIFYPVLNKPSLTPYVVSKVKKLKSLTGYVMVIVQFDAIYNYIKGLETLSNIQVVVQDISVKEPFLLYGNEIEGNDRLSRVITFDAFKRKYLINISEVEPWINQEKDLKIWITLFGLVLGGFIFQLLVLMMPAYTVQLSHRVALKTQTLKREKEVTEQKNRDKTYFLKTLGGELKSSIDAIHYFVDKFHQQPTFEQAECSIGDIRNASENLTQLVNTVIDLTEIEAQKTDIITLSIFDVHHVLHKVETLLNASNNKNKVCFSFFIDDKVPHLIESDELRIQKLIIALAQNSIALLHCHEINVAVKAHEHQLKRTTLFFVLTPMANIVSAHNTKEEQQVPINQDLAGFSTSMAMVKKCCQLFDGEVKLNQLASGQIVLSASIKVDLPAVNQVFTEISAGNLAKKAI